MVQVLFIFIHMSGFHQKCLVLSFMVQLLHVVQKLILCALNVSFPVSTISNLSNSQVAENSALKKGLKVFKPQWRNRSVCLKHNFYILWASFYRPTFEFKSHVFLPHGFNSGSVWHQSRRIPKPQEINFFFHPALSYFRVSALKFNLIWVVCVFWRWRRASRDPNWT